MIRWVDLSGSRLQAMRIPAWQTRIVGLRPIYTPYPLAITRILRRSPINKDIAADVLESQRRDCRISVISMPVHVTSTGEDLYALIQLLRLPCLDVLSKWQPLRRLSVKVSLCEISRVVVQDVGFGILCNSLRQETCTTNPVLPIVETIYSSQVTMDRHVGPLQLSWHLYKGCHINVWWRIPPLMLHVHCSGMPCGRTTEVYAH